MSPTRREFVQSLSLAGVSLAFGGCDAANDALVKLIEPQDGADLRPSTSDEIDEVSHALNRLTWGAAPGEYRRVSKMGVNAFIEEQLNPTVISDRRCDGRIAQIESLFEATPELYDYTPRELLNDLTRAKILRAVYSKRQLLEVMIDFWTDHFNIVSSKGDCKWLKLADDREVIRPHALGSFREMVRASALSPAMLIYLDGHANKVENPGDRPNENFARELMELHTLGVHGGYTQKDVMAVARCLSGWTIDRRLIVLNDPKPLRFDRTMSRFNPTRHDHGNKVVLGESIPAGGGARDLDRVIDLVCGHPSTARHIATKLCRRFIADPPPDVAIDVVAKAFANSHGDIKTTLRAMFATEAFRESRGNLFKRPFHFVVSSLRVTDAKTDAGEPIIESIRRMGHAPFQYPTPDGYPMEEPPWLGTLLWRWNFAVELPAGNLKGTSINAVTLAKRLGDQQSLQAHLLGRQPNDIEAQVLAETSAPITLLLACPAFQRC